VGTMEWLGYTEVGGVWGEGCRRSTLKQVSGAGKARGALLRKVWGKGQGSNWTM
jgi:hypothetical protein